MATEAQINANRANAQHSTGPSSPEGKLIASHNAVKNCLTGRTVLLRTDDVAAYEKLIAIVNEQWLPETDPERLLVQSIVDAQWRLLRIPVLEGAIWSLGRTELAEECAHIENFEQRALHIEALIMVKYKSELSNLTLQDSRIRRTLEKLNCELHNLQAERIALEQMRRKQATSSYMTKRPDFEEKFGFEFSSEYLFARADAQKYGGNDILPLWDRTWRDKSAKTPN